MDTIVRRHHVLRQAGAVHYSHRLTTGLGSHSLPTGRQAESDSLDLANVALIFSSDRLELLEKAGTVNPHDEELDETSQKQHKDQKRILDDRSKSDIAQGSLFDAVKRFLVVGFDQLDLEVHLFQS